MKKKNIILVALLTVFMFQCSSTPKKENKKKDERLAKVEKKPAIKNEVFLYL